MYQIVCSKKQQIPTTNFTEHSTTTALQMVYDGPVLSNFAHMSMKRPIGYIIQRELLILMQNWKR